MIGRLLGWIGGRRAPALAAASTAAGLEAGQSARRLSSWVPSRQHVNSLISASGDTVICRARYLVRNNGYAAAAVEAFASASVGAGIMPSWRVKDQELRKQGHD